MSSALRARVAASRFARVAALPERFLAMARYDARVLALSGRWLVQSREHTNFTYDLQELNRSHLAWFVAEVTGAPVAQVRSYMAELLGDRELADHVRQRTTDNDRAGLADAHVRFGRRVGWYAMVRALRPGHVVETGTDKG